MREIVASEDDLPRRWVVTSIRNVVESISKINPQETPDKLYYYCDIDSIDNLQLKITKPKQIFGKTAPSRARQLIKQGDILFSTVRTYLKNIGVVSDDLDGQLASTGFCVIRSKVGVNNKFIFNYIQSKHFLVPLSYLQRGTSYPAVRNKDVLNSKFLLPPLNEQKRIVSKIESIFAQIDAAKQQLELLALQITSASGSLAQLKSSVLKQAFEGRLVPQNPDDEPAKILKKTYKYLDKDLQFDKNKIPEGWKYSPLEHVADVIDPHPSHRAPPIVTNGFPFAGIGDISKDGIINIKQARQIGEKFVLQQEKTYDIDDKSIGYSRVASVGKIMRLRKQEFRYAISPTIAVINPYTNIQHNFLFYSLHAGYFFHQVYNHTTGSTRRSIGITKLRKMLVRVPPQPEQHRIVTKIESIFGNIDSIEKQVNDAIRSLNTLKQSVLKLAFEGKLVPQDPNDEPASVLFEKIKSQKK